MKPNREQTSLKTSSANNRQVAGDHYKNMPIETWDIVSLLDLDFFQGNILRYVLRWRDKAGIVDLEKALHSLEKYIEIEKLRAEGANSLQSKLLTNALNKLAAAATASQTARKKASPRTRRTKDMAKLTS